MLLHPTKKIGYVPILKNASTSFDEMFRGWIYGDAPKDYYVFAVVRDPSDRFISAFERSCVQRKIIRREDKLACLEKAIMGLQDVPTVLLDEHLQKQVDHLRLDSEFIDRYFTLENLKNTWEGFRIQQRLPELIHLGGRKTYDHYSEVMERKDIQEEFWEFYGADWKLWEIVKYREEHPWE